MNTLRLRFRWALVAGLALVAPLAGGATNTWKGAANGNWFATNNWTAGVLPVDGDDVIVTNSSILLTNSTANLASFIITNATVTFTNWTTALNAGDVQIRNGGIVTHVSCTDTNVMTNRVWIVASNVTIEAGGKIDVTGKGYATGPGAPAGQRNGAGYGGLGGYREATTAGRLPYGSPWAPLDPGSGQSTANHGGGAVRIEASGHVLVNGIIKANGQEYAGGYAGEGSGGGVHITCRTFGGTNGSITVHGDDAGQDSASGAGGRIAVGYDAVAQQALPRPSVRMDASGGTHINGQTLGEMGTICLTDGQVIPTTLTTWNAQLYGPTNWYWPGVTMSASAIRIGGPYDVSSFTVDVGGNLTLLNNSTLTLYSGPTNIVWTNYGARLSVTNDWLIGTNCWLYLYSSSTNGGSWLFEVSNLTVQAAAGINADSGGYSAGYGPGRRLANVTGGGYGGRGQGYSVGNGGASYGSSNAPVDPGSPGSVGRGGGLIRIMASKTVVNDGTLTANGQTVADGQGAGSGGGISIQCWRWGGAASGSLSARGGSAGTGSGAGGGGGRIAVWRAEDAYFGGYNVTNGTGAAAVSPQAQVGTLVLSNITVAGYHTLTILGRPANRGSPTPQPYGGSLVAEGTWVTNTVSSGANEANGIHYDCIGWSLTNNAGPVSNGLSNEAAFPMTTNLWLTWNWTTAYYLATSPATNGTLQTDRTGWYTNGTLVTVQAVSSPGYSFSQWSGDTSVGGLSSNPLTVVMNQARTLIAHFAADTPQSKTWSGIGDWFVNYTNWNSPGAPGPQDLVTVSSGRPTLKDSTTIRTLSIAGGTSLVQVGVSPVTLTVTENLIVSNNGTVLTLNKANLTCGGLRLLNRGVLYTYASPTNSTAGMTGLVVQVGGTFFVANNCWVYPYSDSTNGGSACFLVGNLNIEGTNGGFNADAKGFAVGYGPGRGDSTTGHGDGRPGGAYGGFGGGDNIANTSIYGSSNAPVDCGSPGEIGRGGGLVRVFASGNIVINGVIRADGQSFTSGYAGAGSGGGIYLRCRRFTGTSNCIISARGGDGGGQDCGGGGGGRIAIWSSSCTFNGQISVTNGPTYWNHAVTGTVGTIVWGFSLVPGTIIILR